VATTHSARNVRVRVSGWGISSWAELPRADGNGVRRRNKVRATAGDRILPDLDDRDRATKKAVIASISSALDRIAT
jgi:hypothetical protein